MDNRKISDFLSQKRKEKNLTQQQLADMLNVTPKAVSKWETAKGLPDIATVPALCSALGISATEFFTGENINIESHSTKNDLIINVAKNYTEMGKKQTVCFYTFIICLVFLMSTSFFGDGTAKIIVIVFAFAVSGISVYKLASINLPDIKKLQKIALISLICITSVSVSLGINYFLAKNTGDIIATTYIAKLIFGDYNYTLQKFLLGFKNAVSGCALVSGQNLYLLSAYLKTNKTVAHKSHSFFFIQQVKTDPCPQNKVDIQNLRGHFPMECQGLCHLPDNLLLHHIPSHRYRRCIS